MEPWIDDVLEPAEPDPAFVARLRREVATTRVSRPAPRPHERRRSWLLAAALLMTAATAGLWFALTRDEPSDRVVTPAPTFAVTATTTNPTTTAATTTTMTTTPAAAPGWSPASLPSEAYGPCCGSDIIGQPSPPFPADDTAPLPDGRYAAGDDGLDAPGAAGWSTTDPAVISIVVYPFESCADRPNQLVGCWSGAPGPDSIGYSTAQYRTLEVSLDEDVTVGVIGERAVADGYERVDATAPGPVLVQLLTQLAQHYEIDVLPIIERGADDAALLEQLIALGSPSWTTSASTADRVLFQATGAPGVVIQGSDRLQVSDGPLPVDQFVSFAIRVTAVDIVGGRPTVVYFNADFES
ncbi:MAG: hypothetical protein ACK5OX_14580 [Desertimonas sp.]